MIESEAEAQSEGYRFSETRVPTHSREGDWGVGAAPCRSGAAPLP